MTIWKPHLDERGPVYLAITRAVENDIESKRLQPGDRLPTHRELAASLGVNVGTVTRAFAEARRRGLVRGEVGRGTFVREPAPSPLSLARARPAADTDATAVPAPIDLSINLPLAEPAPDLAGALRSLADSPDLRARMGYADPAGPARLRRAGAGWLAELGVAVTPDQIVVCAGAQHAIWVSLAMNAGPGETVLCEALTYPGFLGAARSLGLRVRAVDADEEGVLPDALEASCREERPRLFYCMPALQNPTATALSEERRQRVAEIATEFDLRIVQDDVQAGMVDDCAPSIARSAPEHVLTIATLSKTLDPALRIAFLAGRGLDCARAHEAIWSSVWMASPLGAEIASDWLESRTPARIRDKRRREMDRRHALVARVLDQADYTTRPGAYHLWLRLPKPWSSERFTSELERRGVRVSSADAFMTQNGVMPTAVRVSISGPRSHAELEAGLEAIGALLRSGPDSRSARL